MNTTGSKVGLLTLLALLGLIIGVSLSKHYLIFPSHKTVMVAASSTDQYFISYEAEGGGFGNVFITLSTPDQLKSPEGVLSVEQNIQRYLTTQKTIAIINWIKL